MASLPDLIEGLTTVYRRGEEVEQRQVGNVAVTEFYGYPHTTEAAGDVTLVDLVFVNVGVHIKEARALRDDLLEALVAWNSPTLRGGPSYIHSGGELGSQEYALRLFGLMQALDLADIMTGRTLGISDEAEIRALAGQGLLYAMPKGDLAERLATVSA